MLPSDSDQFFFPSIMFAITNRNASRIKWVRPTFYLTEELSDEDGNGGEGSTYRQLYASLCLIAESRTSMQPGRVGMETYLCDSFDRSKGRSLIEETPIDHFLANVPSDFDVMKELVPLADGHDADFSEIDAAWRRLGLIDDTHQLFCWFEIGKLLERVPLAVVLQQAVMAGMAR